MKQSACSAVICQPGGHEQKHDIGGQCGATASDKTVQVPVIVNQTQNSANPIQPAGVRFQTIQTIKVHQNLDWESVQNCESWDCEENDTTTNAYNYSGDRDCHSRPYWLWWVCANLQCSKAEHWAVNCEIVNFNKLWKTVKINILEELTFSPWSAILKILKKT